MTAERSAYAILGLRPGAGRAEVNDAYRKLMKRYHPDRPGGDANRAAEINRAYTLLRRRLGEPVRVPVAVPVRRRAGPPRFRKLGWLVTILIVGAAAALENLDANHAPARAEFLRSPQWTSPARVDDKGGEYEAELASFDMPVQPRIVSRSIADAVKFHSTGDLAGASAYSRDCQISLRQERNLGWFDACAAFDEAMLALYGDSDQPDSSPFNESAVVTREISAARMLSDDTLGADSHLHQIRSQVDMEILPMLDSAATAQR
jgi:hypothetical protein